MKTLLLTLMLFFIFTGTYARSQYKVTGNDVIVELEGFGAKSNLLKIELWSESVVRVVTTMNDDFSDANNLLGERNLEEIKFKAAYAQNNIEITTVNLLIIIGEDGLVSLMSRSGRKLLIESDRKYEAISDVDNLFNISQSFYLSRKEDIYGMGQNDTEKRYLLRNESFDLVQDNTSIASPVFFSEKGYAFIWDNYSATKFSDSPGGLEINSALANEISYFFIYGPEWNSIISSIRNVTGKAKLLPKWAYGFHLNPQGYKSTETLNSAISKYKTLNIPVENKTVDNNFYLEEKQLTSNVNDKQFEYAWAYKNLKEKYITANTSEERAIIPTHTNLPGIQQFGTYTLSGEITNSWETLKSQVSAAQTSTFTGQLHWSTTLGGVGNSGDPVNKELMVRWYQFAAFTPVFQGAVKNAEVWDLGESGEKHFDAVAQTIKLRQQLIPYIYSVASKAVFENKTIIRSMLYSYSDEDRLHTIDQQYMFGPSIMACPVTDKAVNQIDVKLPAAFKWFDFWTGELLEGGRDLKVNTTLSHIPLYVKQGSIIPLQNIDSLNAPIEIRIYGGSDAEFILYEDENEGLGYLNEQNSKIEFKYIQKNKTLTINSIEGEFPGLIAERIFNVVLVSTEDGIGCKNTINFKAVNYKGKRAKVKFD